ncbi:MAG: PhnD/SsuA/transferrin family substrate-binding protein [Actinomycetota bacterium]|nr:PhnD/SsuA/transferrin family substrate-binding protein [Actinomycetota bacterium]
MLPPLRFVTYLAPNVRPVYEYVARVTGERLGIATELVDGSSCDRFAQGEGDVAFVCGLPYVELASGPDRPFELLGAPVLTGERYEDRPIYFSDVIVRAGSEIGSFMELRGRSWSYNEPHSHSGYAVTRAHLAAIGEPKGFFGRVVEAGYHQRSIELVRNGAVDASAIDSQVLEVEMRAHPGLRNELRVIGTLGPSTIQPVVAASHLAQDLKAGLREVILGIGAAPEDGEALARGLVARYVPVEDPDYDDIREMVAAADKAGVEWC